MAISAPFIRRPIGTSLLMAGDPCWSAWWPFRCCRWRRCRRSISRPSRSRRNCPAPARRPWRRRWRSRWSASSRRSPASTQMTSTSYARRDHDRTAVRSQPQHRRRRQRRAGGDQRRRRAVAEEPARRRRPTARSTRPTRRSCARRAFGHPAADRRSTTTPTRSSRSRSRRSPASAQVIIGGQQKPAVRVQVDPAKLAAMGLALEDVRAQIADRDGQQPEGHASTATTRSSRSTPTTSCSHAERLERRHRRLSQRRAGPGPRHRPGGRRAGEHQARRRGPNGKRGDAAGRSSSSPAPTSSRPSTASRRRCRGCRRRSRRRSRSTSSATAPQTIRASVDDVEFTLLLTIALVVMVIFLFLRNFWATLIPSVTVPLALLGTLRGHVPARLQPRQSVADGADASRSASWSTTPSSCSRTSTATSRTAMPPLEAALKGAARDRLHHHLDQRLAGRRVHPAAADGRHRRPPVPRIRRHA